MTSLLQKFQFKPGLTLLLLNPPPGYYERLAADLPRMQLTLTAATAFGTPSSRSAGARCA